MSHGSIYEHFKNYLSSCFSQPSLKWNVWHHNEYAAWKKMDSRVLWMRRFTDVLFTDICWGHIQICSCNPLIFPKDMAHEFKCGCSINQIKLICVKTAKHLGVKVSCFLNTFWILHVFPPFFIYSFLRRLWQKVNFPWFLSRLSNII